MFVQGYYLHPHTRRMQVQAKTRVCGGRVSPLPHCIAPTCVGLDVANGMSTNCAALMLKLGHKHCKSMDLLT
jgi:hypothetical protein